MDAVSGKRNCRIEDYAMIGDCQTAALVSKHGSIDWLCLPRFDSDACFAALLGSEQNGRWKIAPAGEPVRITRRYWDDTLILETLFETGSGTFKLIDFMPVRTDHPDLIRIVEGVSGTVPVRLELLIRFGYGLDHCWVQDDANGNSIVAIAGPDMVHIQPSIKLQRKADFLFADFKIASKERQTFVLSYQRSHKRLPEIANPGRTLQETREYWEQWARRCGYEGKWKQQVLRSLITLKSLVYTPTGGILAAATTSLPEKMGGERNWDYRYCWIRDATFSLYSLLISGYREEANAWRQWLLRAVAGDPSKMQILYGLAGERRVPESELEHLIGFCKSKPVRIGNAAYQQFQLDVYGELMDSMYLARRKGLEASVPGWELQTELLETLSTRWKEPDEGIWEVRGRRRHFTHSKIMAWVAVDRMIKTSEQFQLEAPLEQWRALRTEICAEILKHGFNTEVNSFVQYYGSKDLDASLLMIPLVGFLDASDSRVTGTVEAIEKNLTVDGFVLRYHTHPEIDALPAGEGVFLPCSFWLVDNYVLQGRRDEAIALFERLIGLSNDVGLLSEEYDPAENILLGNFPQAFSHVSLINSAWNLTRAEGPAQDRKKGTL